ncbi:B12-binding domain-containing protein [Lutispora sp.]|uniref:cobalamin B12-binding domain-containing protein n=1 Tax=Lutispora sp. TaxID=2828727 RepID=UPI003567029C
MSKILEQISENVLEGQTKKVVELVEQAINEGCPVKDIINEGLIAGMNEVGELFKEGEVFVPEVLISAKAMNAGMELLKPLIQDGDVKKIGRIVMATVKGDLHDIGKKLVGMMMEGAGYEIIDLGVDIPPEKIVEAIKEYNPDLLGMSAMLTTTMVSMKDTIETLKESGLYEKVKVMVGGAPVTPNYAEEIGAHYSGDATAAVELANNLMGI